MFAGVFLRERYGCQKLSTKRINEILNPGFVIIKKQYNTGDKIVSYGNFTLDSKDADIQHMDSAESEYLCSVKFNPMPIFLTFCTISCTK